MWNEQDQVTQTSGLLMRSVLCDGEDRAVCFEGLYCAVRGTVEEECDVR